MLHGLDYTVLVRIYPSNRSRRQRGSTPWLVFAVTWLACCWGLATAARAQEDDWDEDSSLSDSDDANEDESTDDLEEEVVDADELLSPTRLQVAKEHRPGFASYRLPESEVWSPLEWAGGQIHGQVEIDVGYAAYFYPENDARPEEALHDMRGRFVLGPFFQYELDDGLWLNVLAQTVTWVREQDQRYQINVDDIYAQIAGENWDFQVGRFLTWRVYHKGLGYDIFTLEDQGVHKDYPISNEVFAVHTYEVDYMFLRNSPYVGGEVAGRAAFHYYPADILGFELAAAYGLAGSRSLNTLGGRLAADLQWKFLRVSAAGEYRQQRQTGTPFAIQNQGTPQQTAVGCPLCGGSNNFGFGGSVVLTFDPVRIGGSGARGVDEAWQNIPNPQGDPGPNNAASGTRLSLGGFAELDLGALLLDERSLIVGAGGHRTELTLDNSNQEFHFQTAAYVALPLGVNNAMAKLVVSNSWAEVFNASSPGGTDFIVFNPSSRTVRFRISSNF